jgi:hypothetical protein
VRPVLFLSILQVQLHNVNKVGRKHCVWDRLF